MSTLRTSWRSDRGDILVTPAVLALVVAVTLVTAGLTYVAARNVAPGVDNARQGQRIDDEGNVVQGGVGVIPVPTPTAEPTEEPTEPPRQVVTRTRAPAYEPTPTPYVYTNVTQEPYHTQEPYETEEPDDTPEPHGDCCQETMSPH